MIAKSVIAAIWILVAALLFRLLSVWDQMPERVAVHFGITLKPDGWASRKTFAVLMFLVVAGHAALSTWLALGIAAGNPMVGAIELATATILFSVFWQVITFNIAGTPLKVIWIVLPALLLAGSVGLLVSGGLRHHALR